MWAKILHHHIHLSLDFVYYQGDTLLACVNEQHGRSFIRRLRRQIEVLCKQTQGINVLLYHDSRTTTEDSLLVGIEATNSVYDNGRNSKLLSAHHDHHGALDRQAGGELHGEGCSLPRR